MKKFKKREALDFHAKGRPGKIEVVPTKSHSTQRDLSLAYSPGVAEPCLEIHENSDDVYKYTAKSNLVAVISNGTAVLGLGDIGALASKPVMEGKGLLFKIYADIDVFDIEVDQTNIDDFIKTVKAISPTFGGINLEDIKAPECFEIERRLVEELDIPVMHDDQHGTAIISAAALLNASEIQGKKLEDLKVVVNGAGAAAVSCTKLYISLGVKKEHVLMCDSKGVIRTSRTDLNPQKQFFAQDTKIETLAEAMKGADVFIGLSKGNIVTEEMLLSMNDKPIVFAMANPDPEISYSLAIKTRKDLIMATGRSDHPNQVNNVLGFPYIFRGAMDVRAAKINEAMKLAATKAIARLAKEIVPEEVLLTYSASRMSFGKDYIIPKPNDPRLISVVAPAVARAAMESGVAQAPIEDWDEYIYQLNKRMGRSNKLMDNIMMVAKNHPQRVVFAEADNYSVLKAAFIAEEEGIATPILLGRKKRIEKLIEDNGFDFMNPIIIDPKSDEERTRKNRFAKMFWEKRQRSGYTLYAAEKVMRERNYFGAAMVEAGEADAMISGITRSYPNTIRPALKIVGTEEGVDKICGLYIMNTKKGPIFLADTTINTNPTAEELANITALVSDSVVRLGLKSHIAMLSFSNFGSSDAESSLKIKKAVSLLHKNRPDIVVDGEIQANFALNKEALKENFPFSPLVGKKVNTLIFPNLESGNIAYKLLQNIGGTTGIGPIVLGLNKSIHVLPMGSGVDEIVNMVAIAAADAHSKVR
ncbi:MAG: NADP-dependent malic enzyme [Flavobacteriales bacterium]|jgi:malate dehydrogenase (oxaloacetate-decarboxylating)(NADP+)|nr:NADP-dependent malic enzyme [Flavobacteriales bacterium]